jgi:hypothetical protein
MKLGVNGRAFSIFSRESAYWAGFIAADGNVDHKGRLRVYLGIKDIEHLYKLKEFLGSEHKVAKNETLNRCSFELTDKNIVQGLRDLYNIKPNKSYDLMWPSSLPSELCASFIRGYWDGDGSLCETFSNSASRTASFYATVVGSDIFINEMFCVLENVFNKRLPYVLSHQNGINAVAKLNTNDAIKLSSWMYLDSTVSTRLDRKYLIYKKIVIDGDRLTR